MVLSWIAAGVLETCADATAASARTTTKHNLFIGNNLCQILTPSSAKVADPSGMGHLLTYSLCEFRLTRAAFKRRKEPCAEEPLSRCWERWRSWRRRL